MNIKNYQNKNNSINLPYINCFVISFIFLLLSIFCTIRKKEILVLTDNQETFGYHIINFFDIISLICSLIFFFYSINLVFLSKTKDDYSDVLFSGNKDEKIEKTTKKL